MIENIPKEIINTVLVSVVTLLADRLLAPFINKYIPTFNVDIKIPKQIIINVPKTISFLMRYGVNTALLIYLYLADIPLTREWVLAVSFIVSTIVVLLCVDICYWLIMKSLHDTFGQIEAKAN
jgi:ABC-type amino acid transport system permease subunit